MQAPLQPLGGLAREGMLQLGSLAGIASLAVTILQLVAIVLLFRADARAWLSDDADDAEAP